MVREPRPRVRVGTIHTPSRARWRSTLPRDQSQRAEDAKCPSIYPRRSRCAGKDRFPIGDIHPLLFSSWLRNYGCEPPGDFLRATRPFDFAMLSQTQISKQLTTAHSNPGRRHAGENSDRGHGLPKEQAEVGAPSLYPVLFCPAAPDDPAAPPNPRALGGGESRGTKGASRSEFE